MLGTRKPPSSRALSDAIDILNAVGTDKGKLKVLDEIKQAQAAYEATIDKLRDERRAADKAKAEAIAAAGKASDAMADAAEAGERLLKERVKAEEQYKSQDSELRARKALLTSAEHDFDTKVKRENAELDRKRATLGDVERQKKQADALMAEAAGLRDRYREKLAKLKAIAEEE